MLRASHTRCLKCAIYFILAGFIVDLAALVWVIFILATSCHKNCHNIVRGKFCQPIKTTHIHSLLSFITMSPLLCIANHFPYIIISYISDPYHAGSISIVFFLTFILFYFVFGQFYSRVALRTGSRPKDYPDAVTRDIVHFPKGDACRRKVRVPFNTQVLLLSLGENLSVLYAPELMGIQFFSGAMSP